jgi:hypothetical protein
MNKTNYVSSILTSLSILQGADHLASIDGAAWISRVNATLDVSGAHQISRASLDLIPTALLPFAEQSATGENIRLFLTVEQYLAHKDEVDASGATILILPDPDSLSLHATDGSHDSTATTEVVELSQSTTQDSLPELVASEDPDLESMQEPKTQAFKQGY